MEGYDFDVVGEDIPDYKCPICFLFLREALLLPCSHSVCKFCLTKWEQESNSSGVLCCPSCKKDYQREKVSEGDQGRFIDRVVTTTLKVRCKQHSKSCDWTGTISEYEIHEKSCKYSMVPCRFTICKMNVCKKDLAIHEKDCPYRIVECPFCAKKIAFVQMEDHLYNCNCYDVACPESACDKLLKRKEVQLHVKSDCPNTEVSCPFQLMGCKQKIFRKDLAFHINNFTQHHTYLLLQSALGLVNEVNDLKESNKQLASEMQQLKDSTSKRITELEGKLKKQNQENVDIRRKLAEIEDEKEHTDKRILDELKIVNDKISDSERYHQRDWRWSRKKILSHKDKSKEWSFAELKDLMKKNENEKLEAIIEMKPHYARLQDSYGYNLLHIAGICITNKVSYIDVLVNHGCQLQQEDQFGWKPVHYGAHYGHLDVVKKFISIDPSLINCIESKNERTPLHCAALNNQVEMVKYLLQRPGIQINSKDNNHKMADEYDRNPPYKQIQKMIREHRVQHS